jgi:threonine/homoserine/homoserine lactone efflux protein
MPSTGHVLAFALTAFLLIVVPGPSVLFVVSRTVTLGRRAGLATVAGNAAGIYLQVVAVALGIGAIVERSILAFSIIKVAGAVYLVFLGIHTIRHRRFLALAFNGFSEVKAVRRLLVDGFLVGVTNPKGIILFAAILPQFVDRSAGHVLLQLLVLGVVSLIIALVSDTAWALAAGSVRSWLGRSPRRLELLGGSGGLVMIGLGARLVLTSPSA